MSRPWLVDATDLEVWANRRDAQAALPQLVRGLVQATTSDVQRVEFRAGEGVHLGGWDGVVLVEHGNAFVPDGLSVWELGTSKDQKGKADDDYDKRSRDPLGIDPTKATFVFVTARRWKGKDDWALERAQEGKWRDVRAYDADSLETWLEEAPAVHIWISNRLGKLPEGVSDIDSFWSDWSSTTDPRTSPELVLAGRQDTAQAIHGWLETPSVPLVIRAESRPEALAVFAAAIQLLPEPARGDKMSRVAIVRNLASWDALVVEDASLVLVQGFENAAAPSRALQHGHVPVIILGRADSAPTGAIEVPRLSREEAAKALHAMGVDEPQSGELATLARRSLITLRRKMSTIPDVEQPSWARPEHARALLPALFAGRWSGSSDGDRDAMSKLAGASYEEVHADIVRWSNEDDPPVRCVGEAWYLTSEEDAWSLLARFVTRDELDRLQQVVADVLGTPDPAFDVEEDRRWMAGVLGHSSQHSSLLKTGLANTLAIMGARAEYLQTTGDLPLARYASACVRSLLETPDWKAWASLPLPLLAEAAPDEFLAAVDRGLADDQPTLAGLFGDEAEGMFSSPLHTDLLWALERLAWSEDYLSRATASLGKLARLDPGGRWANRPSQSLRTIFLPWLPRTTASLDRRLAAMDSLRRLVPEVAWKLMRALLPREVDHQDQAARPLWREWAPEEDVRVTGIEYAKMIHALAVRLLEDVGVDGARWSELVEAMPKLPHENYEAVVTKLGSLDPGTMPRADSASVWNALRTLISRHRSHSEADWSLPNEEVDRLADVLSRIEPREPLLRYGWLFESNPALPQGREDDWEQYQREIACLQCNAVQTLHQQDGVGWIAEFVETLEQPNILGAAIARSAIADQVEDLLLREYVRPEHVRRHQFIAGFVHQSVLNAGLEQYQSNRSALGAC